MLEDPWQDSAIPIRFHDEDGSVAAIVDAARLRPLDGLIALGDRPTVIAARAGEALDLPVHPAGAAAIARDKQRTRERLRAAGLPVPWFLPSQIDANPRELRDVARVSVRGQAGGAVRQPRRDAGRRSGRVSSSRSTGWRALLRLPEVRAERNEAHDRILIEGFIPGREFALEGLMHHGALQVLALFDKPDPLDGPFFEETIYVTPSSAPAELERRDRRRGPPAAAAIGLRHGPIHAECRVNEGGVFVLEVAARPIGGLCSRALRFNRDVTGDGRRSSGPADRFARGTAAAACAGRGARRLVARAARLRRHDDPDSRSRRVPRRSGVEEAQPVDGVDDVMVTAKMDQLLVPLPEGASYLGFIFAHGATSAAVSSRFAPRTRGCGL